MKFLLIDNYDSFTHMLADYIRQCGVSCDVIRNDKAQVLDEFFVADYDALVLSPGPKTPEKAGYLMQVIHLYHQRMPILGICLGHQAIGQYFGAKLVKAKLPKHGKFEWVNQIQQPTPLFKNIPEKFGVIRYHSLIIKDLKSPLKVIAQTQENEIMALAHHQLPLFGVQYHPESCLTKEGLVMVKNFTDIVQLSLT